MHYTWNIWFRPHFQRWHLVDTFISFRICWWGLRYLMLLKYLLKKGPVLRGPRLINAKLMCCYKAQNYEKQKMESFTQSNKTRVLILPVGLITTGILMKITYFWWSRSNIELNIMQLIWGIRTIKNPHWWGWNKSSFLYSA